MESEVRRLLRRVLEADVVVLDARSGEILALSGGKREGARVRLSPELALRLHPPGSVLKIFTVAAALELGIVNRDTELDGEDGRWSCDGQTLRDIQPRRALSLGDVLAYSSNIGAGKIAQQLGVERLAAAWHAFHLDDQPTSGLPGASPGRLPALRPGFPCDAALAGAGLAGGGLSVLHLAAGLAVIANGGLFLSPTLRPSLPGRRGERVLGREAAGLLLGLLEGVVGREGATGAKARIPGYRVAGKTGTARERALYVGHFVGVFPAASPKLVIAVAVTTAQSGYTGGEVAAPAFQRIGARLAARYRIPREVSSAEP